MVRKKTFTKVFVLLIVIITSIYSANTNNRSFSYCLGASALLEVRKAERSISDIDFNQELKLPVSVRPTFILGRHFYPTSWLRIELLAEYSFSKADDDTIANFLSLKHYKAGGADLNVHLRKEVDNSFALFAGVGGGFLITSLKADNNDLGYGGFKIRTSSPVLNLDAGCEIIPSRKAGFAIGYSYRFWRPTQFIDDRDMPLQGADYKEIVHSHGIVFKVLVGKKQD